MSLFGVTLLMAGALGVPATAAGAEGSKAYGKVLVTSYDIPAETLESWAEAPAPKRHEKGSPIESALLADTIDWFGPALTVDASSNPYTVAVMLTGHAKAAGTAGTLWQAGWRLPDSATAAGVLFIGTNGEVGAGEKMTLSAAAPTRFKESNEVAVYLGLINVDNFEIESARVEVWQGFAEASWWEMVLSFRGALVGLVFLAIVLWFRR
jgi:hypothetical protein